MRLHEYQAKQILSQYGIPVPRGRVATSMDEVREAAEQLGARVVLKAQVLTSGRGSAGGIQLANDASEAEQLAGQMFGMNIRGYMTSKVLIDEAIDVEEAFYLGIAIDRTLAQPVIVASARGGIEIAQVVHEMPEHVYRIPIDPLLGLRAYQARELADDIGLSREQIPQFVSIALSLYQVLVDYDATLVEANPLVARANGDLVSLNTRIVMDDDALYRHREWIDVRDESQETPIERLARRHSIGYVRLGGTVGCLSNGAGLAMATIDLLMANDVRPANFVDIHRGANAEKVVQGIRFALNGSSQAILINCFCVLIPCDVIARGIATACKELALNVPMVVRLEGLDTEAGYALLDAIPGRTGRSGLYTARSSRDAVLRVVDLVRGSRGESGR